MKVTAIETIRVDEFPNLLWVQVHTDEGLVGLGETFYGPEAAEAHIHGIIAPCADRHATRATSRASRAR